MNKIKILSFCLTGTLLLLIGTSFPAQATPVTTRLIAPTDPYLASHYTLGNNPARAAYLKQKNRFQLASSIENLNDYQEELYGNPDQLLSLALPLGDGPAYFGFSYTNRGFGNQFQQKAIPTLNLSYQNIEQVALTQGQAAVGMNISFPIAHDLLYLGLEVSQEDSLFSKNFYHAYTWQKYKYNIELTEFPHYRYGLGLLWQMAPGILWTSTYRPGGESFFHYKEVGYAAYSSPTLNQIEFMNSYQQSFGMGLILTPISQFSLGLSTECFSTGIVYDLFEKEFMQTKAFTRTTLATETKLTRHIAMRLFGSIIPQKDARTNYYDWEILNAKRVYAPADSGGELDVQNIFNEEEFGFDLEISPANTYAITLGAHKTNFIFPGAHSPEFAIHDGRIFLGCSFPGILEPDVKAFVPAVQKGTSIATTLDQDTNIATPEQIILSASSVLPGTNLQLSLTPLNTEIIAARARLIVGAEIYVYKFYEDLPGHLITIVPIMPNIQPGDYKIEVLKTYNSGNEDLVTLNITVKRP